jgi:hypothetical protein
MLYHEFNIMTQTKSRFNFALSDMLLVLAMIGAGEALLVYHFFRSYPGSPPIWAFAIVVSVGVVSGAATIVVGNRQNFQGLKRVLSFVPAAAATILISGAVAETQHRKIMADNERDAAHSCKLYAEAQEVFHRVDWDRDGLLEYTPTMSDLWETMPGTGNVALISAEFAAADATRPNVKPYKGYLFKPLHSRLVNSETKSYILNGNQTLGYALIAYPAEHGRTGCNSFLISSNGTIYQQNFGPRTLDVVSKITLFAPQDPIWAHDD